MLLPQAEACSMRCHQPAHTRLLPPSPPVGPRPDAPPTPARDPRRRPHPSETERPLASLPSHPAARRPAPVAPGARPLNPTAALSATGASAKGVCRKRAAAVRALRATPAPGLARQARWCPGSPSHAKTTRVRELPAILAHSCRDELNVHWPGRPCSARPRCASAAWPVHRSRRSLTAGRRACRGLDRRRTGPRRASRACRRAASRTPSIGAGGHAAGAVAPE